MEPKKIGRGHEPFSPEGDYPLGSNEGGTSTIIDDTLNVSTCNRVSCKLRLL
jgi:hypothetical protein